MKVNAVCSSHVVAVQVEMAGMASLPEDEGPYYDPGSGRWIHNIYKSRHPAFQQIADPSWRQYSPIGRAGIGWILCTLNNGVVGFCLGFDVKRNNIFWYARLPNGRIAEVGHYIDEKTRVYEWLADQYEGGVALQVLMEESLSRKVADYFIECDKLESPHGTIGFNVGFRALSMGHSDYFLGPMHPFRDPHRWTRGCVAKSEDRAFRFEELISLAEEGDLFIFSSSDKKGFGKLIQSVDQGIWTHVVPYLGNFQSLEIDTDYCGISDIRKYRDGHEMVGLFRIQRNFVDKNHLVRQWQDLASSGIAYSKFKAVLLGLKCWREEGWKATYSTPNGLVRSGRLALAGLC